MTFVLSFPWRLEACKRVYTPQGVKQVMDVTGLPGVVICKGHSASFGKDQALYKNCLLLLSSHSRIRFFFLFLFLKHPSLLSDFKNPCWWERIPDDFRYSLQYDMKCVMGPKLLPARATKDLNRTYTMLIQRKNNGKLNLQTEFKFPFPNLWFIRFITCFNVSWDFGKLAKSLLPLAPPISEFCMFMSKLIWFLALLCATAQQSYCRHAGLRRPSSVVRQSVHSSRFFRNREAN